MPKKNKYGLDQFYTKPVVARKCLETLNLGDYDTIIEPSAGEGVFFHMAQHENKLGYDLEPKSDDIQRANFLEKDLSFLNGKKVLFFGNPPFGRNSSMALKFVRKCCEYGDTVAFILPKGFKKRSMIDKIPLNFEIVMIEDLEDDLFTFEGKDFMVPCVWVVIRKSDVLREKEIKLRPTKFTFTNKENSNLAIRRVGINAGNVFTDVNVSEPSHYFLRVENPNRAYELISQLTFSSGDTTGPRSIPKNELIIKLDEIL
jgi:hypothetical protein